MSQWKHGFLDCFGSLPDCAISYFCPCIHAAMASDAAGLSTVWSVLQCFFYPCLVPVMRNQVRESKSIEVKQ